MTSRIWILALFALALAVPPGDAGGEEAIACPNGQITVETGDAALAGRICDVADDARAQIAECGLALRRPVAIALVEGFEGAHSSCLATYDCRAERIEIIRPDLLGDAVLAESPFRIVPTDLLFDSLITHELTHAALDQMLNGETMQVAATEYMAYAMQVAALPEATRTALVAQRPVSGPVEIEAMSDLILMMAPGTFAVKAWTHFSAPENGCGFFAEIIDGSVRFPPAFP